MNVMTNRRQLKVHLTKTPQLRSRAAAFVQDSTSLRAPVYSVSTRSGQPQQLSIEPDRVPCSIKGERLVHSAHMLMDLVVVFLICAVKKEKNRTV